MPVPERAGEDPMTTATATMFLRQRDEAILEAAEMRAERDRLRAELERADQRAERWCERAERAEAERDVLKLGCADNGRAFWKLRAERAEAERDEARDVLREAREWIDASGDFMARPMELLRRIDEALGGL